MGFPNVWRVAVFVSLYLHSRGCDHPAVGAGDLPAKVSHTDTGGHPKRVYMICVADRVALGAGFG